MQDAILLFRCTGANPYRGSASFVAIMGEPANRVPQRLRALTLAEASDSLRTGLILLS
jgi:hypothetical protein